MKFSLAWQCAELERKAFLGLLLIIQHIHVFEKNERAIHLFVNYEFRFIPVGDFCIACGTIKWLLINTAFKLGHLTHNQ